MFDPKLYREACRELTAPEDKIEEIIAMTEKTNKKKIRPLRTALICAAAAAMMVVSVAAANPEEVQEFFYNIASYIQVDKYRTEMTTTDGEKMTLMNVPQGSVENRDGRAILVIDGDDIADITDALAKDQHYVYEESFEASKIILTVDGTIDQWSITADVGTLEVDGSYNWFGGVTTTSEDYQYVAGCEFSRPSGTNEGNYIVSADDVDGADSETVVGIYTTDVDIPAQN